MTMLLLFFWGVGVLPKLYLSKKLTIFRENTCFWTYLEKFYTNPASTSLKNFRVRKTFGSQNRKKVKNCHPPKKFEKVFPMSRFHRFRIDLIGAESGTNFFSLGVKKFRKMDPKGENGRFGQNLSKNGQKRQTFWCKKHTKSQIFTQYSRKTTNSIVFQRHSKVLTPQTSKFWTWRLIKPCCQKIIQIPW